MPQPLVIDCHGHYTTAPPALEEWRKRQIANLATPEMGPKPSDLRISDVGPDIRPRVTEHF